MNKYIKYLLIPIMLFGVNGNSCYSMDNVENTIQTNETNKYSKDTILLDDFQRIILQFKDNVQLNEDQETFVKQLYRNGEIDKNKVELEIYNETPWSPCFLDAMLQNSKNKYSYYKILNLIVTDSIDMVFNKILNINLTHQDIKAIYSNLLNKIKQCYKKKLINKDKYLYILGSLLYTNTARMFYKLGGNSVQIKKSFNNSNPLYKLFFNTLKRHDTDYFLEGNDKLLNYDNIDNLQNSYELYKLVMKQIINDMLTVFDSDGICEPSVLEEKIFEPIILGLWSADANTTGHDATQLINEINNNYSIIKKNIDKIDQEFKIKQLYKSKEITKHVKGLSYIKEDGETKPVQSKYIAQYICSFVAPGKLPKLVQETKDKKNKDNKNK